MGYKTNNNDKKRGRPMGFKLSEASKRQISMSKTGQRHSQKTKDKISHTLLIYFKRKSPLSEEIINDYCRVDNDEVCEWVNDVQDELDNLDDVNTERIMHNTRKMELAFGNNIEYFGHGLTPEALMLFKEYCKEHDVEMYEIINEL